MSDYQPWVVLSDGAEPTEDIYFYATASPWLEAELSISSTKLHTKRWYLPKRMALSKLTGANILICRSLAPAWLNLLESTRNQLGGIYYLIDDDLSAAVTTEELPESYRQRLGKISIEQQPRILALADEVVATSQHLVDRFKHRHGRVSLLTPPLLTPLPTLEHFKTQPPRIGYYGTRAHLQDLNQIAPAIERIHQQHPNTRLEVMLGKHTPGRLQNLERLTALPPLPWNKFLTYQGQRRIQIGLAPLWGSDFNQGKSHIKFLDISIMGGIGVYSRRSPYEEIVKHGVDGMLAGDDPEEWYQCISYLIDHPNEASSMAAAAAKKAQMLGNPSIACQFWLERSKAG